MKTIIITGSVASGKTTLAKTLAKKLNYRYIDVNVIIKKHKLRESYDKARRTYEVDEKKLAGHLQKLIKSSKTNMILDSHLSHYISPEHIGLCIVTKCDLKVLKSRLKKRKYNNLKIQENLEAEIFQTCLLEAKELGHKIMLIDTTKKPEMKNLAKAVADAL